MNAETPGTFAAHRQGEPFEFTRFFTGKARATGIFEDRFGRVRTRLSAEMTGSVRGDVFEIDEVLTYEAGGVDRRLWTVTQGDGGTFLASCPDAASVARGRNLSGMVEMTYRFQLPVFGRRVTFDFLDRLHDMGEGRALNRVRVSKWGILVGELTLCFTKI